MAALILALSALLPTAAVARDSCIVMGDSLAIGISTQLPRCQKFVRLGVSTSAFRARYQHHGQVDVAIVSLGSNDGRSSRQVADAMASIRARINARRVVWVVPAVGARDVVMRLAGAHGDAVMDAAPLAGRDGVHPSASGYRYLARRAMTNVPEASSPERF